MSIGTGQYKIKTGGDFITSLNRNTLKYTVGAEGDATTFTPDDAALISELRKEYPEEEFVVLA